MCVGLSGWSEGKKDSLPPIPSPLSYLSILAFSPSFPTPGKSQPGAKRSLVDICQICQGKSHVQNIWRGERKSFSDAYVTATNLCDIGRCHSPSLQTGRVGNSKKERRTLGRGRTAAHCVSFSHGKRCRAGGRLRSGTWKMGGKGEKQKMDDCFRR